MTLRRLLAGTALLLVASGPGRAEDVTVAAAANLVFVLEEVATQFEAANPDVDVTLITGASGSLVAQLQQGAPYDVFLSADLEYPRRLIDAGRADRSSLTVFARGQLVLWTTRPQVPALDDLPALVRSPHVRRIAFAQPDHAPYGAAARAALQALGLWTAAEPKMVPAENVAQVAQFTDSGAADLGFVAKSLVLSPRLRGRGRWREVPEHLHPPLEHGAVLTSRGARRPAARNFLHFLQTPEARAIFARWGYTTP